MGRPTFWHHPSTAFWRASPTRSTASTSTWSQFRGPWNDREGSAEDDPKDVKSTTEHTDPTERSHQPTEPRHRPIPHAVGRIYQQGQHRREQASPSSKRLCAGRYPATARPTTPARCHTEQPQRDTRSQWLAAEARRSRSIRRSQCLAAQAWR